MPTARLAIWPMIAASGEWWTDSTLWAIVGVAVAVVFGAVTVWAQFASARMVTRAAGERTVAALVDSSKPQALDLSGQWVAGWQSFKDGEETHRLQPVEIEHLDEERMTICALKRGAEVVDGGYLWAGELRLWDNAILMGWYAATEGSVRSKGTLYFALHPHGQAAIGRWVGLSHDGVVVSGRSALARTAETAENLLRSVL